MPQSPETAEALFARYGPRYRIYVTVVALLGTVSAVVTTTTVNVALPDIMGAFGIGQDRGQWMITGNLAGQTVGQLLSAWLISSFGQRKTFVVGLCIFVVSLLTAALSPNELVLVAARVVQGLMAGVLQSLSMFTLFSVFPPEQRGMAMGYFSINTILGPAVGPTLGGILIQHFDWRSIFYMGLPFSVVGILFGSLLMPEREETDKPSNFD
jgi:MFS family permease